MLTTSPLSRVLCSPSARRLTAALSLAMIAGCSGGLEAIDARTDDLVREHSARVSRDAVAPIPRAGRDQTGDRDQQVKWKPGTTYPAADDLRFSPADEARDIQARLERFYVQPTEGLPLDLVGALKQAQKTSREYLSAEEEYISASINLLIERHAWGPILSGSIAPAFNSQQNDGDTASTLAVIGQLEATQKLPGGSQLAATWVWNATENLRSSATGQYVQSSQLALSGSVPLLRGAGDVADESRIQAERNLVYAARNFERFRADFFVAVSRDFYSLIQQLESIDNTKLQLESSVDNENRLRALFEAGRQPEFEVFRARNQTLTSVNSLNSAKESYTLSLDRFRIRLGLPLDTPIIIVKEGSELSVPEPDVTLLQAVDWALEYRLDLQNERDRLDDTRRSVRNAKNQLLPDLNLAGNVRFPTGSNGVREGGLVYELDDVGYGASLVFGLPLDRERERLALRQAMIGLEQSIRSYDQFRDNLVVDVRARVRNIEQSRSSLELADEAVRITERRQEEQRIRRDEILPREIVETQAALLQARNARDQARTNLRNAILDYLVATGQMRIARDGTLVALPGMDIVTPPTAPNP